MKNVGRAMAIAAIMMLAGGSAIAMAGDEGNAAPQKGTWEYALAMETGKLAPIGTGTIKASNSAPVEETVQIGWLTYRIHIDMP